MKKTIHRFYVFMQWLKHSFLELSVINLLVISTNSAMSQNRMATQLQTNFPSTSETKALHDFWTNIADYGNIAGNCYSDGETELSNSIGIVDDSHLRQIIINANRKANEPIPISGTIYNMGTGQQVQGSRMNDAAGFHCELYKTSKGIYVLGFAGTKLEVGDIINDYKGKNTLYGQSKAAVDVAQEVVNALKEQGIPESKIVFTGHSLGGRQAQEASIATGINAVVFNSADLSKETKQRILMEPKVREISDKAIIKISSVNDVLTNFQRDHTGFFGEEVVQNRVTVSKGGTHSIRELNNAINDIVEDATFAEKVSHFPKKEQDICYRQYYEYKKDIENAESELFIWQMREKLAHEMSAEAKFAAPPHSMIAMGNKEAAENALELAKKGMKAIKETVRYKYEQDISFPTLTGFNSDDVYKALRDYVFDTSYNKKYNLQKQDLVNYTVYENSHLSDIDFSEGGHVLYGNVRISITVDPTIKVGEYKLCVVDNFHYLFLNSNNLIHVDKAFITSLLEQPSGTYSFAGIHKQRNREGVIPGDRNRRGL